MGETGHTPGPWIVREPNEDEYDSPHYQIEANVRGEPYTIAGMAYLNGPDHADARLIAAAPDLLEACESVLRSLVVPLACVAGIREVNESKLRAALLKAKGA